MAEQTVLPYLAARQRAEGGAALVTRILRLGRHRRIPRRRPRLPTSSTAQTNPTIAPYAKTAEVHLRIAAKAADEATAQRLIAPVEAEIRTRLGLHVYGADDETLEGLLGPMLHGRTLAVAESCTGGLIGHRITNVSGSSDYFLASLVTYSNEEKVRLLGVPEETLKAHGAVSRETAAAMAEGVRKACRADIGLSVTGIAGPTGGTEAKPVGLVYLGLADAEGTVVEEQRLRGNRLMIKERAAQWALYLLYRRLRERLEAAA